MSCRVFNFSTFIFLVVAVSLSFSTFDRFKQVREYNSSLPCRQEDGYHRCFHLDGLGYDQGEYCIRRDLTNLFCNITNDITNPGDDDLPCYGGGAAFESKYHMKTLCLHERYIKCREETEVECQMDREDFIGGRCKPRSFVGSHHNCTRRDAEALVCNNQTEFRCLNNGRCIPREWVMDTIEDCTDRSDEQTSLNCYNRSEFSCSKSNGRCLPRFRVNDGFPDCAKGEDEQVNDFKCDNSTEFDCRNPLLNRCIPRVWVGNRLFDCTSKRDETERLGACLRGETMCADGSRCLPSSYLCDGIQHCSDASDEINLCDEPRLFTCFRSTSLHIPWSYTFDHQSTRSCSPDDSSEMYTSALLGFKCKPKKVLVDDPVVLVPQFYIRLNISICQDWADVCYDDAGRFNCSRCLDNKTIISRQQICDDFIDCPDLSDECSCGRSKVEGLCERVLEGGDQLLRSNLSTFCDGKADLKGGIDEKYCNNKLQPNRNTADKYACLSKAGEDATGYNETIPMRDYCDGNIDCQFMDDECKPECLEERPGNLKMCFPRDISCTVKDTYGNFGSGSVLTETHMLMYSLCNGMGDCTDNVDEQNCPWRIACNSTIGLLNVNSDTRCDGVADCYDQKDEQSCKGDKVFTCWTGPTETIAIEKYQDGKQDCDDNSDECKNEDVSSPREMIKVAFLLNFVWISSAVTLIGNAVVIRRNIIYLTHQTTFKHSVSYVNKLFITHLALSDFLMGIALLIIAIRSRTFTEPLKYCAYDYEWRPSSLCNFVGVLTMISAETSLNILVLLTAFRTYISYKPFSTSKLNLKLCHGLIFLCWFIALTFAIFPIALIDVFADDYTIVRNEFFLSELVNRTALDKFKQRTVRIAQLNSNQSSAWLMEYFFDGGGRASSRFPNREITIKKQFSYYGASSVCFPDLYANRKPQYTLSCAIISYNLLALLAVLCCYVVIYKRSKKIMTSSGNGCPTDQIKRDEDTLKRRILYVVLIDKLCWVPIIIMAVLSFMGIRVRGLAHSITFIILIPIQSAANPFIYSRFDRTLLEQGKDLLEKIRLLKIQKKQSAQPNMDTEITNSQL